MNEIENNRKFMRSNFAEMRGVVSDQQKGKPLPPLEKPAEKDKPKIKLSAITEFKTAPIDGVELFKTRKSRRKFTDQKMSLPEFSFLLWATHGVKDVYEVKGKPYVTMRTVPSAGARHPFETYLVVNNVESLEKGLYRYLPIEHELQFLGEINRQFDRVNAATLGQTFCAKAAALFIWSCIPYRGEWRYHKAAHKAMLLDAGHICENLYLACEMIGAGTCAIAAYDQEKVDALIEVDGKDEFAVYLAPVGKI